MLIKFSDSAKTYLDKKIAFYNPARRVPRIILAERSCSGAVFRLFFDAPASEDTVVTVGDIKLHIQADLINEFSGFSLDVEHFFFSTRLSIEPIKQSYRCNCDAKCNQSTALGLNKG